MLKRALRRVVYFGIPIAMWIIGAACTEPPKQQDFAPTALYRCSRVGCDRSTQAADRGAAPTCSCGATMVLDSGSSMSGSLKSGESGGSRQAK